MRSSPSRPVDTDWLIETPYAHRGLHGAGRVENSRAAIEAAIAAGLGIEIDVQASRRGSAMVFHDDALDRLTGERGLLAQWDADELAHVRLKGCDETIPSLDEILGLVGERVPLLIEVKARGYAYHRLCRSIARSLGEHSGPAAMMSFNPMVVRWFAHHCPRILRGLVISEAGEKGFKGRVKRQLSVRWARPQFLAYDIRDLPSRFAARERMRGLPILTWTVRTRRDQEIASAHADQIIHELPGVR